MPTRRSFLKKSAAAGLGFSVLPPHLALGRVDSAGRIPPSARVNLACIGVGGRGSRVIPGLCNGGHAIPVALCDVDFKVPRVDKVIEQFPDAKRFKDFRVMLDEMEGDIDAVSVCTPDHTHFTATMDAMRRGKHVYVEKPLTHSFREADLLMQAEKKFGVVTQMGNQGHTSGGSQQFERMLKDGVISDITAVDAWKSPGLFFMDPKKRLDAFPAAEEMPSSLDWDLWCGPAEVKPFSAKYHPFDWRAFYLYGNGMLGDWGAHILDFVHEGLQLGLPTEIRCEQMVDHNEVIFPLVSKLSMKFPARGTRLPEVEVRWHDGEGWQPQIDEQYWSPGKPGEDGKPGEKVAPKVGGAGTLLYRDDGEYLVHRGSHGGSSRVFPLERMEDFAEAVKVERPKYGHLESFTQACLGNDKTRSPFSVGGELTQVLLLGVICQYLNESLEFDRSTQSFRGNSRANALLEGPAPRKEWAEFYEPL